MARKSIVLLIPYTGVVTGRVASAAAARVRVCTARASQHGHAWPSPNAKGISIPENTYMYICLPEVKVCDPKPKKNESYS